MNKLDATKIYALVFGLFLGLCIWKFGNPVILDQKISSPTTPSEFWNFAWPPHWANWILLPLIAVGAILTFQKPITWPQSKWLWLLPLGWLGWQFVSASHTVDADLTTSTLWQFSGCVACYFIGALFFRDQRMVHFLLIGILAVFTFCLVRAVNQKLFEFPQNYRVLAEGEKSSWTNFPPETIVEMKRDNVIVTTNGVDVANPVILKKFEQGRVAGTLVYPNALAGLILLLWPVALALAFKSTRELKPLIRIAAIALAMFLGAAAFFWTGSKLGWLTGMVISGICLFQLNWPKRFKLVAGLMIIILGLGIFAARFHHYFAAGATSVGARLDYWQAAARTTKENPVFGTGPGTFQRPYALLKSPEAEMARLTHNDYLEQFSDSGIIGGLTYGTWIFLTLVAVGKTLRKKNDVFAFAVFAGLLGWFIQGFGEFGLFIPASAWTAFTLLGCLVGREINQIDKKPINR